MIASLAVSVALLLPQDPAPTARSVYEGLSKKPAARIRENLSDANPQRAAYDRQLAEVVNQEIAANQALFAECEGVFWRGMAQLFAGDRAAAAKAFEAYADDPKADKALANQALARAAIAHAAGDLARAKKVAKRCDKAALDTQLEANLVAALTLVGEPLPEIPIDKVLNGPPDLTFQQLKNNVLVLEFFATWCGPCRTTIPYLVELQGKNKHLRVQVVGITTLYGMGIDFADKDAVVAGGRSVRGLDADAEHEVNANFVKAFDINYPIVFTGRDVPGAGFGVQGIPTTVVVGLDGKVVGSVMGSDPKAVMALVEKALAAGPAAGQDGGQRGVQRDRASSLPAQQSAPQSASRPTPLTTAERSGFTATSTHQDVLDFLAALRSPRVVTRTFGTSQEGKPLPVAIVSDPPCDPDGQALDPRLRVLIVANIHGGEVEGKEAAQMLVRECAQGLHRDLLEHLVLLVVPDFNADGNDKIGKKNRVAQNGPDGGVGRRENAQGLDLNRDFVKLETPEARSLVALMNRFEPHAMLDLHTTNGSYHGYHVTYATSLSPSVSPALAEFATKTWIRELSDRLEKQHSIRTFDYGNFENDKDGPVWASFEPHPRYLSNYFGLRNGLSLLCEAYSYLPFEKRVRVTREFVLEALAVLAARSDAVRRLVLAAERPRPSLPGARAVEKPSLGYASELGPATTETVLRGEAKQVPTEAGMRTVAEDAFTPEAMRVRRSFVAKESIELPGAWAILGASDATRDTLLAHGLVVETLGSDLQTDAEVFAPAEIKRQRSFQKHTPVALRGAWHEARLTLPKGTLLVPASPAYQPKALLAAHLLEPQSDDSLATWNHFDAATRVVTAASAPATAPVPPYPVVRLSQSSVHGALQLVDRAPAAGSDFARAAALGAADMVTVQLFCDVAGGAADDAGRKIHYELGPKRFADLATLEGEVARVAGRLVSPRIDAQGGRALPYVFQIRPGIRILPQEVGAVAEMLRGQGLELAPIRWQ